MIPTIKNLSNAIRAFQDEGYSGFKGFPPTHAEAIVEWAAIAEKLLSNVVPTSTSTTVAHSAFLATMAPLSNNTNGLLLLQSAFVAYASSLIPGMLPAFVGTPPVGVPGISTIRAGEGEKAAAEYAEKLAEVLITWAKTGTATPSAGGSPINWN